MSSHADRQPITQFKAPVLKLVWKPSFFDKVKWRGGLIGYGFRDTPRQLLLIISLRGILLWGVGAMLAAYFIGTASLAWLWGRNPYNHVTYADLVLPTRWSELRAKRGQGHIDEGIHEIRAGKYASGIMRLSRGLQQRPSDTRGRMMMAQIYMGLGQLHRSQQLLEEGLDYGPTHKSYREVLFRLTTYLEDYEKILLMVERLDKARSPDDLATGRWLLTQKITALEKLQRYDEIEQLRQAHLSTPSTTLESAWARVQAIRGNPTAALAEIARDPVRFGLVADRCQLQLTLAVSAKNRVIADEAIKLWLQDEPTQPRPRVEELLAMISLDDTPAALDRMERFFIHFGSDKPAVLLLLKRLAELPDIAWLQTSFEKAREFGALSIEAHILMVQGLLVAGKVSEALAEFKHTSALIEELKVSDSGWREGTQLLFEVILNDSPSSRSLFLEFFRNQRLRPDAFRFALKSLHHAKSPEVVGELSIIARNRFPALQDAALVNEPTSDAKAMGQLSVAFRNEMEARMELRRIDEELQQGDLPAAFTRLKVLESAGFPALQHDLLRRRIQAQGGMGEQAGLSAALQIYLAGANVSQDWLRQLALKLTAERQPESAVTIARETFDKFPQARWTLEMLTPSITAAPVVATTPAIIRTEAEARVELRRIDEDIEAGRHREALDRIRNLERAKFTVLQSELLFSRIQASGFLNEQAELVTALSQYLARPGVNQAALRELADKWERAQLRDSALSLLRATQMKIPQARWATEMRKKIEGDLLIAPEE